MSLLAGATICPDKNKNLFLFSKDVGGGEFYQIFSYDVDNANYKMLTDGKSRNGGANWNNKGDKFSFFSTKRNGTDWDIYVADINASRKMQKWFLSEGGAWYAVDWSPNDKSLNSWEDMFQQTKVIFIRSILLQKNLNR